FTKNSVQCPRVVKAQPFYEAGSCQEEFGVDWFTLLFEFPHSLPNRRLMVVVSFNGATSLILGYEFLSSGLPRVSRHLNQFPNLPSPHSSLARVSCQSG